MNILLADDSPTLRRAVASLLESEGHRVIEAGDGVEAIVEFSSRRPDLVIVDADMPRLGGHAVCRLLKEDPSTAAVPVLMLTGRDQASDEYWSDRSGADGYMVKQQASEDLVATVNTLAASRTPAELSTEAAVDTSGDSDYGILVRVCEMLERELAEATMLHELVSLVLRPGTPDETAQDVARLVARFMGAEAVAIASLQERVARVWIAKPPAPQAVREFEAKLADDLAGVGAGQGFRYIRVDDHGEAGGGLDTWRTWETTPVRSASGTTALAVVASSRESMHHDVLRRVLRSVAPTAAAVVGASVDRAAARYAEAAELLRSLA